MFERTNKAQFRASLLGGVLLALTSAMLPTAAYATTCSSLTTISNGTTADATPVNNNFSSLLSCANTSLAPLASPSFTGNVGIGTSSPGASLDLSQRTDALILATGTTANRPTAVAGMIRYNSSIPGIEAYYGGAWNTLGTGGGGGSSQWTTSGSNIYYNTGNVGIGTTTPQAPLQVGLPDSYESVGSVPVGSLVGSHISATSQTLLRLERSFYPSHTYPGTVDFNVYSYNAGGVAPNTQFDIALKFASNATQTADVTVLSLLANGDVGVGTTSPSYTLHVNGSVAGTSAYNNLSDARLKKNVTPITNALVTIEQLRGVRFDWRTPDERSVGKAVNLPVGEPQIGFIAQDVKQVLPEAVTVAGGKDALMSMEESKIVPVLVEAVKELEAINKNQTAEIDRLQHRVSELERKTGVRTAANENAPRASHTISRR